MVVACVKSPAVAVKKGSIVRHAVAVAMKALSGVQASSAFVARRPILFLLILRVAEELGRRWRALRVYQIGRSHVLGAPQEIDGEIIQGCILSTEHLLSFGRVEKRTLFSKPLLEVLGGNIYLVRAVLKAAADCRRKSQNCMVMRWLPPGERYHSLQACLNVASSLFGPNFVHFNALDGENNNLFKSTWYCLTVTTPTRCESDSEYQIAAAADNSCNFTDMSRVPRATLRVTLVNESEIRRIADGKLVPPKWGFFNSRHAERYRLLADIAANFQFQLLRTPADGRSAAPHNPFTSERVHANRTRPDGGLMKRVHSQPSLALSEGTLTKQGHFAARNAPAAVHPQSSGQWSRYGGGGSGGEGVPPVDVTGGASLQGTLRRVINVHPEDTGSERHPLRRVASPEDAEADECNCFLRLHIPHYIGPGAGAHTFAADAGAAGSERKSGSL